MLNVLFMQRSAYYTLDRLRHALHKCIATHADGLEISVTRIGVDLRILFWIERRALLLRQLVYGRAMPAIE